MATTTGTLVFYDSFIALLGNAANLTTDTFYVGLGLAAMAPDKAADSVLADIHNEHASANGYERRPIDGSYTQTGGVGTFTFANPVFTASGGDIVARYYFIYDDTVASDPLVCYGLLNNADADVTTTSGNTLTLNVDASGLFTLQVSA